MSSNQTPTSHHLDVIVRRPASGKWQDMDSHYHSANLVILLPFAQLLVPLAPQDDATTGVLSPFKRRRLADDPNSPWLEGDRSKNWIRRNFNRNFFRNVEVTQVYYAKLQKCLKERHSDRDLLVYDGGKHTNVLTTKCQASVNHLFVTTTSRQQWGLGR